MMPSVHVLSAITIALRTKPKTSVYWFPFAVFVAHAFLDLTPHIEPDFFGWDLTLFSPGFWWTVVDIILVTWFTWRMTRVFPEHRWVICLGFVGAFGPDVVQAVVVRLPAEIHSEWFIMYTDIHSGLHTWWKDGLPIRVSCFFALFNTLLLWWVSWRFMPRRVAVPITSTAPAVAATV